MNPVGEILFRLYALKHRRLREWILKTVVHREGGEFYSRTLRKIFSGYHRIEIGMYSYGGCFSPVNVPPGTLIGRYCSFARDIRMLNGNHPMKFKSTHPFFFSPAFGHVEELLINRSRATVGNDVWIGHGAIILPSVAQIGNGAVIAAGSVVAKDVAPFAVVAGNPARLVKYRFNSQTIELISRSAWWEKDIEELKANPPEFASFLTPME